MTEFKTVETLDPTPFKRLIMTVGNLPTSFVDSMSFYECIAWLVNYIQNTVVPAINNNAEALQEVEDYVKNIDFEKLSEESILKLIAEGKIDVQLTYNAATEALTLQLGEN